MSSQTARGTNIVLPRDPIAVGNFYDPRPDSAPGSRVVIEVARSKPGHVCACINLLLDGTPAAVASATSASEQFFLGEASKCLSPVPFNCCLYSARARGLSRCGTTCTCKRKAFAVARPRLTRSRGFPCAELQAHPRMGPGTRPEQLPQKALCFLMWVTAPSARKDSAETECAASEKREINAGAYPTGCY